MVPRVQRAPARLAPGGTKPRGIPSCAAMAHVVWDWNGTLVADVDATIESINAVLSRFGVEPIDATHYARHYCRPVRVFYEHLMERSFDDVTWAEIDRLYHDHYHSRLGSFPLSAGAEEALAAAAEAGHSQSLLSMWSHERLVVEIDRYGIGGWFERVEGSRGGHGDGKADSLVRHLDALGLEGADVVLVGDAIDDADAARAVGARSILVTSTHHPERLREAGVPIVDRLIDALELLAD